MAIASRLLVGGTLLALMCWAIPSPAQEKNAEPKAKLTVMQRKLKYSQQVLEGLALRDFAKIDKGAEELTFCLKEAGWQVSQDPQYTLHSNDFLRQVEALQKASKNKNLDGATVAYVGMTFSCVKCHEQMRETRIGLAVPQLPLANPKNPASGAS